MLRKRYRDPLHLCVFLNPRQERRDSHVNAWTALFPAFYKKSNNMKFKQIIENAENQMISNIYYLRSWRYRVAWNGIPLLLDIQRLADLRYRSYYTDKIINTLKF